MSDIIDNAKAAIGKSNQEDYILNTYKHAEELKDVATELSQLLSSAPIKSIIDEYDVWDRKALDIQRIFNWWSQQARWAVFFNRLFNCIFSSFFRYIGCLIP